MGGRWPAAGRDGTVSRLTTTTVELRIHPSPHPFVRKGLVVRAPPGLETGEVVTIVAPDGSIVGDGFWNGRSDIAVRRLTRGDVRLDLEALTLLLERAVILREQLVGLEPEITPHRLVHAEGDGLSGLVIDRFGDVLAVELHSAGWLGWIAELLTWLHARLGTRHHRVEMSPRVARLEGVAAIRQVSNDCPRRIRLREQDVRFEIDLEVGHKTGFFCDQRDNRSQLVDWVEGRDVLDLCCHTGGFAVTAATLGAPRSVTAVDLDETALAQAKRNANINQVRVSLVHADAFDWARQVGNSGRRFGAVVLDPPKFIPTRKDEKEGEARYHDLNRLALGLVEPGGLLVTCSCSGILTRERLRELITTAARKAGRDVVLLAATGTGADHPVALECPESEYLKVLWLRVH